jgi:hypothetical protein
LIAQRFRRIAEACSSNGEPDPTANPLSNDLDRDRRFEDQPGFLPVIPANEGIDGWQPRKINDCSSSRRNDRARL